MSNCAINSINPLLQIVYTSLNTVQTSSTIIPPDNTIPQNTEGDALMSLTIKPSSSSSILVVEFTSFGQTNAVAEIIATLFQDAGTDSLASVFVDTISSGNIIGPMIMRYVGVAGTDSPTTFYVRYGSDFGTMALNCDASLNQLYGGVASTVLSIKEFGA